MDPLSIAASVAGLVTLTAQVSSSIVTYIKAAKDHTKGINQIAQELNSMQLVLEQLEELLKSQSMKKTSFAQSSVLANAIMSCKDSVQAISEKLPKPTQSSISHIIEKLKWPFTEKETQKKFEILQRYTSTFSFSLTVEDCKLLSQTSAKVTSSLELQLYTSKTVLELTKDIHILSASATEAFKASTQVTQILNLISTFHGTTSAIKTLSDNVELLAHRSEEAIEQRILDWLSSTHYSKKHRDVRVRRLSGTGQWLLDCARFRAWLGGEHPLLWCTGNPGVGKSVLTSLVIDHISDVSISSNEGLAYFYFDFSEQNVQTPATFVGSIVRQLVVQRPAFPPSLVHFYRRFKEDEAHGSTSELVLILRDICATFDKCYFVIDALDECHKAYRPEILHIVDDLCKDKNRLFVTSRPHSHDIKIQFQGTEQIHVEASEADIRTYCLQLLDGNESTHDLVEGNLRDEVADSISRNAHGMFLLPVLQMQSIVEAMTRTEIRRSIGNLSANLGQAFEDTLQRIENEPRNRRKVAMQSLMWISHAVRPLQITELRHALAIQLGDTHFDEDNLLQTRYVIECCLGLVVVDDESSIVRLVHITLQDFLRSSRRAAFQGEETEIAKICLTYLSLDGLDITNADQTGFLGYAAAYWGQHAQRAFPDEIDDLALTFLMDTRKLARAERNILQSSLQRAELVWHRDIRGSLTSKRGGTTGLHVAAGFGIARLTRLLLNTGLDANVQDNHGNTALHEAACSGQVEAATVLLGRGAKADLANVDDNSPLYLAVSFAHEALVSLLLRQGANPNMRCVDGWTALHEAADKGHTEIVKILLDHKASVLSKSARGLTALHRAAGRGQLEIIKLLLKQDSPVDAATWDGWTPLHGASSSGQYEAASLLLSKGAAINHQSVDGRTPLHRACRGGHYLTVAMLLQKGADKLIVDSSSNTPLHRAAKGGHKRISRLLLDHDSTSKTIQLTAQHIHGRTPRAEASYCGHWKTAALLREEEILHHRSSSDTRSALDIAVENSDLPLVKELLASGLDVNKLNPDGLTPLHQAFLMGNQPLAEFLIENRADFQARTADGWEPLHCASKKGIESAVRLCLDHGADILAATNDGQTALHKVCKSGVVSTTKLLVERGANIEAADDWGWRPLHTASAAGFRDIVVLLIAEGADTEARDKTGRNIQACAARSGHHSLVEYLRLERRKS